MNRDYLTTGIHHYYDTDSVAPNGSAVGTITFLAHEQYPYSLSTGKIISVQEGSRVVGYATVLRILNPLIDRSSDPQPGSLS